MTNEVYIVTNTVVTSLDVLKSVNDLYSSNFTQLLMVMGIIVTVGGVIVPLIFQFREAKVRRAEMKEEFDQFLKQTTNDLNSKLEKETQVQKAAFSNAIKEVEEKLTQRHYKAMSLSTHIQSTLAFDSGHYWDAADSALSSIKMRCLTDDHGNLLRILGFLTTQICPKLHSDDLEYGGLAEEFNRAEIKLREANKNNGGFLNDALDQFIQAKKQVEKRKRTESK